MEDLNDVSPYLRLKPRTEDVVRDTYKTIGALPYRVALAKIVGIASADCRAIFSLPEDNQIVMLCERIDAMREIADKALGTERQKAEDREYREASTRDAPLDEGYDISD